jgi:hypothetical protein
MKIGKKVFYEIVSGNVILDTGERSGAVIATTIDQDIAAFKALSDRNRSTFAYIELAFGAYTQDFAQCNGYRVNPATKAIEFSYPDPNQPTAPPEFQKPLTEQMSELKSQLESAQEAIDFLAMGGM